MMSLPEEHTIIYHTKLMKGGRAIVPKATREVFKLNEGDYLFITVSKARSSKEAKAIVRLLKKGMFTIPDDIRAKLGLLEGDYLRIEIHGFSKMGDDP